MSEIATPGAAPAAPAPAPGGEAPAAPAPAPVAPAPMPPAATPPSAPATPSQPATPPAQPSADEKADDDEWDAATETIYPGVRSAQKKEPSKDEPAKPKEGDEETPATPPNPTDQKPNEEPGASDDSPEQGEPAKKDGAEPNENADPNAAARAARAANRQSEQQQQAMIQDVRTKLFADVPQTPVDADGDPIRGVADVMKLINPATNETFTEQEAQAWWSEAEKKHTATLANIDKQISQIADVNLQIKDEADVVTGKYGEYLKANPEFRDQVWAKYKESLKTDPDTGIILAAPMSLEWFYDQVVGPRVQAAQETATVQSDEAAKAAADAEAAAKAIADAEAETARKQARADRSDIYSPGQPDNTSQDEKEWDAAVQAEFGDRLPKK
jgi:hypothetical protein